MITPPHQLRKAVTAARRTATTIRWRAPKQALAQLSSEFAAWMQAECERLEAARQEVARAGLQREDARRAVPRRPRHQGRGRHLRLSALAGVADSLCRLLEHTPDMTRIPLALVDQHVDAVRAIVREYGRPDIAEMAARSPARCARSPTNSSSARTASGRITGKHFCPAARARHDAERSQAPSIDPRHPA